MMISNDEEKVCSDCAGAAGTGTLSTISKETACSTAASIDNENNNKNSLVSVADGGGDHDEVIMELKKNHLRRLHNYRVVVFLLFSVAGIFLIWAVAMTVLYANNKSMMMMGSNINNIGNEIEGEITTTTTVDEQNTTATMHDDTDTAYNNNNARAIPPPSPLLDADNNSDDDNGNNNDDEHHDDDDAKTDEAVPPVEETKAVPVEESSSATYGMLTPPDESTSTTTSSSGSAIHTYIQNYHVGNDRIFNDVEVSKFQTLMESFTPDFVTVGHLICPPEFTIDDENNVDVFNQTILSPVCTIVHQHIIVVDEEDGEEGEDENKKNNNNTNNNSNDDKINVVRYDVSYNSSVGCHIEQYHNMFQQYINSNLDMLQHHLRLLLLNVTQIDMAARVVTS